IPEEMVKSQQQMVLDEHIRSEVLTQHARELGFRVGDDMLRQAISGFEQLHVDGKFSNERYVLLLQQQGRTRAQFEEELRKNLEVEQLQRGIAESAFVTPSELTRRQALEGEQRDIDFVTVSAASYLPSATVTDQEIQAWYDAHPADYMTPETVDLEYVELKLADVSQTIPVDDAALRSYYEQAKDRLTTPERRRARHILINVGDGVDEAAASKKAEEALAKVNAGGDFAALAKQYSQDAVSAAKGGDLDWATRGMFVGPFEEALFAMNKGEVRGPIKTQFGYHIIRLDDVEGGDVKSFDAARAELETEYRNEKAQTLFYERSQLLADEAFKALTELGSVAETLKLPLQKLAKFTRQGGGEFGSDEKVIEAAFRSEAIEKGQNSPLLTVGDDRAVVLRVASHEPAKPEPVAAVRTQIEMKLKIQAATAAAAKRGAELLAELEKGSPWAATVSQAKLAPAGKRSIARTDNAVPQPIRTSAFDVPHVAMTGDKSAFRGVALDDGGYAVISVSGVRPGVFEAGTPESSAKIRQASQMQGGVEFAGYLGAIEREAKIERNPKAFE
ncbi:MAG TPA: peptidyl-prolyl cis-trans isomerase, partial [Steroidobacteraceae bacterium]|nr:peptidyl-prolyl cis-trans isomerase [Steroidobacteraceae bacterium]